MMTFFMSLRNELRPPVVGACGLRRSVELCVSDPDRWPRLHPTALAHDTPSRRPGERWGPQGSCDRPAGGSSPAVCYSSVDNRPPGSLLRPGEDWPSALRPSACSERTELP